MEKTVKITSVCIMFIGLSIVIYTYVTKGLLFHSDAIFGVAFSIFGILSLIIMSEVMSGKRFTEVVLRKKVIVFILWLLIVSLTIIGVILMLKYEN